MRLLFLVVFIILSSLFILEYRVVGQAVYGDGRYYWAFTRSLYFSHNIDISDEMGHYFSPDSNNTLSYFGSIPQLKNKTKEITHSFSLGVAIIWLPFYLVADSLVVLLQTLGVPVIRNGYSDIYQIVVGIGNIGFVVVGLILLSRLLLKRYTKKIVILTLLSVLFATDLLYYSGLDVINSHPFSFLLVSLLLLLSDSKKKKMATYLFQGVVTGLLAANRTQDTLFLFLPLSILMIEFATHKARFKQVGDNLGLLMLGIVLGYLPQLLLLSAGQGHLALLPHTDQGFSFPTHMIGILFDTKLGIFWYMPVFLAGIVGLFFSVKKDMVARLFLIIILLQYLLISSWDGWHQASYTMRYFISLLPVISFGVAEIFKRLSKRYSMTFLILLVSIFMLHQIMMILGFKLFLQDPTNVGGGLSRSGRLKLEIMQRISRYLQ